MQSHELTEKLQGIRHDFFAMRNGIVADALKKGGADYDLIFGLQLPQLSEIARKYTPDIELSKNLWTQTGVRESRLLACYLFPKENIQENFALEIIKSIKTREEAEILCFRWLRFLPNASEILDLLKNKAETDKSRLEEYCTLLLQKHLELMRQ